MGYQSASSCDGTNTFITNVKGQCLRSKTICTHVSSQHTIMEPVKLSLWESVSASDLTTGRLVGLKLMICGSTKGYSLTEQMKTSMLLKLYSTALSPG